MLPPRRPPPAARPSPFRDTVAKVVGARPVAAAARAGFRAGMAAPPTAAPATRTAPAARPVPAPGRGGGMNTTMPVGQPRQVMMSNGGKTPKKKK